MFLFTTDLPNTRGKRGYIHAAFGVEDIDELMLGAAQMEKSGWLPDRTARGGLARDRASSPPDPYNKAPAGSAPQSPAAPRTHHAHTKGLWKLWPSRLFANAVGAQNLCAHTKYRSQKYLTEHVALIPSLLKT